MCAISPVMTIVTIVMLLMGAANQVKRQMDYNHNESAVQVVEMMETVLGRLLSVTTTNVCIMDQG